MQKCKKITYKKSEEYPNSVILGIIIDETKDFIEVQTAQRKHVLNKNIIQSIEDTDKPFKGDR